MAVKLLYSYQKDLVRVVHNTAQHDSKLKRFSKYATTFLMLSRTFSINSCFQIVSTDFHCRIHVQPMQQNQPYLAYPYSLFQ